MVYTPKKKKMNKINYIQARRRRGSRGSNELLQTEKLTKKIVEDAISRTPETIHVFRP